MKKSFITATVIGSLLTSVLFAQNIQVPQGVKEAFTKKYPEATHVIWEKEKGNYEANWGGKSNEDNSAMYSPKGEFIEIAKAIPVSQLPASAKDYVKNNFKNASINEASIVTDAKGKVTYEAEVNHKDVIFSNDGNFIKTEKE